MRVLVTVPDFPTYSEQFVVQQALGILDSGNDVAVLTSRPDRPLDVEESRFSGLMVASWARTRSQWARLPQGLVALAHLGINDVRSAQLALSRNLGPWRWSLRPLLASSALLNDSIEGDIIHCHFGGGGLIAKSLRDAGVLKGRIIVTFHGADVQLMPLKWGSEVFRPLVDADDIMFTANSRFLRDRMLALGFPEDVAIVPAPANTRTFVPKSNGRARSEPLRVLCVGRLIFCKGVHLAIEATRLLKDRGIRAHLSVIGDGPDRLRLLSLAEKLGVSDAVALLGRLGHQEVGRHMRAADVLVHPALPDSLGRREAQGLVIQEAQASGIPVVAADSGGIADGLIDGETGFLIAEGDVPRMVDHLAWIDSNRGAAKNMGLAGRRFVEANFSLEATTQRLLSIFGSGSRPQNA